MLKSVIKRCLTPIGLAYLAAVLEKEAEVKILDCYLEGYDNEKEIGNGYIKCGLEDEEIIKRIKKFNPDFIGVNYSFSSEKDNVYELCKLIKKTDKNIKLVVGGLPPSNYPMKTLNECPEIDFIILGEGEYRFPKLIKGEKFDGLAIAETKEIIPPTTRIKNLDKLPLPARHLLNMEAYIKINKCMAPYPKRKRVEQIITSRGCPGRCTFCACSNFWGHEFRPRSLENVIKEIKHLIEKYNIQEFQFLDDTMALDKERAIKIFELMKPLKVSFCMANGVFLNALTKEVIKKMKEAGCYQITFSVESGSKKILKVMNKPVQLERVKPLVDYAKKLGISCHGTFIFGFPEETEEDVKKSFEFARYCNFDSVSFFCVSPLQGSTLYDICLKKKNLRNFPNIEFGDVNSVKIENPNLPAERLQEMINKENKSIILRFLIRHPFKFFKRHFTFMLNNPNKILKIIGRVT